MANLIQLFSNTKVDTTTNCIEWRGTKWKGYGRITYRGSTISTHKLSWTLLRGDIPKALRVLHSCDNPSCINVNHLWLGTDQDNASDKKLKGRGVYPGPKVKMFCKRGHNISVVGRFRMKGRNSGPCKQCHYNRMKFARTEGVSAEQPMKSIWLGSFGSAIVNGFAIIPMTASLASLTYALR